MKEEKRQGVVSRADNMLSYAYLSYSFVLHYGCIVKRAFITLHTEIRLYAVYGKNGQKPKVSSFMCSFSQTVYCLPFAYTYYILCKVII